MRTRNTTTAADALGHIHDRSPVVLPAELYGAWFDPTITDHDQVPEPRLVPREVSTAVNSPRNNTASCYSRSDRMQSFRRVRTCAEPNQDVAKSRRPCRPC